MVKSKSVNVDPLVHLSRVSKLCQEKLLFCLSSHTFRDILAQNPAIISITFTLHSKLHCRDYRAESTLVSVYRSVCGLCVHVPVPGDISR